MTISRIHDEMQARDKNG